VSVLLGFFAFGFIGIFFSDYILCGKSESKADDKSHASHGGKSERGQTLVNITQFFDIVLPLEFTYRPWYTKFWIKMLEGHPYIAYLAPAEGRANYTAKKWMCMAFELLNIIFIDSLFAPLVAPDAGACEKYTTASDCLKPSSIDS